MLYQILPTIRFGVNMALIFRIVAESLKDLLK